MTKTIADFASPKTAKVGDTIIIESNGENYRGYEVIRSGVKIIAVDDGVEKIYFLRERGNPKSIKDSWRRAVEPTQEIVDKINDHFNRISEQRDSVRKHKEAREQNEKLFCVESARDIAALYASDPEAAGDLFRLRSDKLMMM